MSIQHHRNQYQPFSSSRYPVAGDTKLWRYLDFEKFAWFIEKSSVFHARMDCLGDPYEGSVTTQYAMKRASGEIHGYMDLADIEPINNRRLRLVSFASCWHANDGESPAMWKLYAHERRGVAVVTTLERLLSSVDTSRFKRPMLGPVEYFDFTKDDMSLPMGLCGRPGFSKREAFSHEREVRGIVSVDDYPDDPERIFTESYLNELASRLPRGVQVPVDLGRLVLEIVVAPLSKDWFLDVVMSFVDRKGLGELVRKSALLGDPVY